MSNVFISHSSHDKIFVRRLATALLSEGIPVWLDSWSLELGDSLLDGIYDGIDASSVVILVVSHSGVKSGWVNRELNAALSKEQQLGRKFIIPVKIDACDPPLKVADRLYADFSSSFSAPLITLVDKLARDGYQDLSVAPDRALVSLSFTRAVHLDTASLERSLRHIRRRHGSVVLQARQIVVNEDYEYEQLLRQLHTQIDEIASESIYSPEAENSLRTTLDSVREYERYLSQGTALMLTNGCSANAVYWFAKMIRGMNSYSLWASQREGASDRLQYGKEWLCAFRLTKEDFSTFFETEAEMESVDVWTEGVDKVVHNSLEVAGDLLYLKNDKGAYWGPRGFFRGVSYAAVDKYIYPQMVLLHLRQKTGPVLWKLGDANVGLH